MSAFAPHAQHQGAALGAGPSSASPTALSLQQALTEVALEPAVTTEGSQATSSPGSSSARSASQGLHPVVWKQVLGAPFENAAWDGGGALGAGSAGVVYRYNTDNPRIPVIAAKIYGHDVDVGDEVEGLRRLQESTGPHKGFIPCYGLAEVQTPRGPRLALLMKEMRADGEGVFNALEKLLDEKSISADQYEGVIQLIGRRTTKAVLHAVEKRMTLADIKPENLLFDDGEDARSVISDIEAWSSDDHLGIGSTAEFMPPEIRETPDDFKIGFEPKYDIFSLGETLNVFPAAPGSRLAEQRADFIRQTTDPDPARRLTVQQALAHPYLAKQSGASKAESIVTLRRAISVACEKAELESAAESEEAASSPE